MSQFVGHAHLFKKARKQYAIMLVSEASQTIHTISQFHTKQMYNSKSKFTLICHLCILTFTDQIKSKLMDEVNSFKHLGIMLDYNLKHQCQIDPINSKSSRFSGKTQILHPLESVYIKKHIISVRKIMSKTLGKGKEDHSKHIAVIKNFQAAETQR